MPWSFTQTASHHPPRLGRPLAARSPPGSFRRWRCV